MMLQVLLGWLISTAQAIEFGSFSNPSSHVRPRFRYWVPDASVDVETVAADIRGAGVVGAGGVELLGYYWYGDQAGETVATDWTKYTWGTSAWKRLQDAALRASVDEGLLMDFTLGPNQGAGVPAPIGDEGVKWDLIPFNVSVPVGGTFDDVLPGWGSGKFIAGSTGTVIESVNTTLKNDVSGQKDTMSDDSLKDITDLVDSNGRVRIQFNSSTEGLENRVFAYYLYQPRNYELAPSDQITASVPQSPITNYVQNGSLVVDHFSSRGAQTIIDFWENHLLGQDTKAMLAKAGNYGWEDSQEFSLATTIWWTPNILEYFEKSRGYKLQKYIPLLIYGNNGNFGPVSSTTWYITDEMDSGLSIVDDYRQTLTELNQQYLSSLTEWLNESLACEFSAQVVYNLEMDMLANIPRVDAPETESLGMNHLIDAYLQYSGPAILAGKQVVSSELGAVPVIVYQQSIPELVWEIDRSLAGNINQFVIHGLPFSGEYPECSWPGFITFSWQFSEMHGPRQPSWDFYGDFLNWTARNQYVFQSAIPTVDVAFWLKNESYETVDSKYPPNDLTELGFTHQYLSPDNFELPDAYVDGGVLAPDRQAFQTLVVRGNDTLTPSGVDRLLEYGEQGLPIVFSGGLPSRLGGHYSESVASDVKSKIQQTAQLPNAHQVPYDGLAASLISLGLQPRASVNSNGTWYVNTRTDKQNQVDYLFVYNDASFSLAGEAYSTGTVTTKTNGNPSVYNTWTGEITPLYNFERNESTVTVPLELAGNQSTILAFTKTGTEAKPLANSLPSGVTAIPNPQSSCTAQLRSVNEDDTELQLSNGTSVTLPGVPVSSIVPSTWNLTVEAWSAPSDFNNSAAAAQKSNTTYTLSQIIPWNQIEAPDYPLQNVSGRGYYSTTINWPPSGASASDIAGAIIDLGYIVETARVSINENVLPPLDPTSAKADVGSYLREGENRIDIVVATRLGNSLRSVWYDQFCGGVTPATYDLAPPESAAYGLVVDVKIVPYTAVAVDVDCS